jgi:hypothetical protein
VSELDALAAKVKLMRDLGVTECDGIKLGVLPVAPPKEETKEEAIRRFNAEAERRHAITFAASASRPKLRVLK